MNKIRYAFVGTGGRAIAFIEPLVTKFGADNELAAMCDPSPTRLAYYNENITTRWNHPAVPVYSPDRFDVMLAEQKPNRVFVCSPDSTHHDYIVRALRAGCDVVTEKPMTTDAEKCRLILDATRETGRNIRVAFNYRWAPYRTKVRELIAAGTIGSIKSVNLEYLLDTSHGADYFRRWHAHREASGTLLVHKATHHFDLVNWWLDVIPDQVFAHGDLVFYGRNNALARGDDTLTRYDRYTGTDSKDDPFRLDLSESESFRRLYLEGEKDSGYVRDRNVFRDDISIYDSMSVQVRYRTRQILTYSLTCFSPREGMRVTFNGDRGRIEYHEFTGSGRNRGVSAKEFKREQGPSMEAEGEWIRVFPHFKEGYDVPVEDMSGPHGGADQVLTEQLFSPHPPDDPWGRTAGQEQGAASILVGIAGVQSIDTNKPVNLPDLAPLNPKATKLSELV